MLSFAVCMCSCPSIVRFGWCLHVQKPQLLGSLCLCVPEAGVGQGMCVCLDVQIRTCEQGQECIRTYRSHSNCTRCLCKASHLFSWFCFSPPRGLQTPLENKGSLKNAALPVFPNVQNAAVSSNGASSDAQPCRCCRKSPACWAATTHLHNPPGSRVGRREGAHLPLPQLLSQH